AGAVELTVPDVFSLRAGAYLNSNSLSFSAGLRLEGSPVHDLIGASNGDRRAGYSLSVEPGILYKMKKATLYAYLPVTIRRKALQTIPDKNLSKIIGVNTMSSASSADYLIFLGVAFKL
ncbi:MAG: hypothetical protein WKF70_14805, partial [Chitinophagaceae bacterium]